MAEIVSFASGKGGVGKTLLTAALGIFLSRKGKKVLLDRWGYGHEKYGSRAGAGK